MKVDVGNANFLPMARAMRGLEWPKGVMIEYGTCVVDIFKK